MEKGYKALIIGLTVVIMSFISTPAFARSVSLKDAGVALWIFVIIGAIIILLQLIPAAILFFTFIGTTTGLILKKKAPEKETAVEKVGLPGYEPAAVKK
jgi:hypothetical protein